MRIIYGRREALFSYLVFRRSRCLRGRGRLASPRALEFLHVYTVNKSMCDA